MGSFRLQNIVHRQQYSCNWFSGGIDCGGHSSRHPLVGKQLQETTLREEHGVNVVGVWERGILRHPSQVQC